MTPRTASLTMIAIIAAVAGPFWTSFSGKIGDKVADGVITMVSQSWDGTGATGWYDTGSGYTPISAGPTYTYLGSSHQR